jgi:hypothetical protein
LKNDAGKTPLGSAPGRSAKSYSLAEFFPRRLTFFNFKAVSLPFAPLLLFD